MIQAQYTEKGNESDLNLYTIEGRNFNDFCSPSHVLETIFPSCYIEYVYSKRNYPVSFCIHVRGNGCQPVVYQGTILQTN